MHYSSVIKFIAVWIIKGISVASHPCETDHTFGLGNIVINCENKIFQHDIPEDLDERAVMLDLSGNNICYFSPEHFSKFKYLVTLIMANLRCEIELAENLTILENVTLEVDTFDDLLSLESLDMSNSPILAEEYYEFHWPKNLKFLRLSNIHNVPWDFTGLSKLDIFVGRNCNKHVWPTFHPMAPLNFVDVRENNFSAIEVEQVADLCLVTVLLIDIMSHDDRVYSIASNQAPYDDFRCMCLRLQSWAQLKDIYGLEYMKCLFTSKDNITKPAILEKPCNGTFDDAERIFDLCRSRNFKYLAYFYLYVAVCIIVIITLVAGLLLFIRAALRVYKGSRHEVIEDPNARDSSSIYYETEVGNEESNLGSFTPRSVRLPELPVRSVTDPTIKTKSSTKPTKKSSRPTIQR